jgi:hypothetical protein
VSWRQTPKWNWHPERDDARMTPNEMLLFFQLVLDVLWLLLERYR